MTHSFDSTNLDEISERLKSPYGSVRMYETGQHHRLYLTQEILGPIELHRMAFTMRVKIDAAPIAALPFGQVTGGTVTYRSRRSEAQRVQGDAVHATMPETYSATLDDVDVDFALIPKGLFALMADQASSRNPDPIRFTSVKPHTQRDADTWNAAYRYVRHGIFGTPSAQEPLVAGAAVRLLVVASLMAFPNNARRIPTPEDRRDAHSHSFRRAVSFIEDNAHRDINASDIAAAAHINIRALQVAFRRHLDTTPMTYLRKVRLEYAHRELISADPSTTSVASIAARWGFVNHSRFTARYRATFGIAPSFTLRQRNDSTKLWM
ncbi:helix-turn-helix transcriptional regulator [Micromonospora sp. NPDC051543]|uniref:helix-turn-helix transcriptional regulator n=1 Tax=Micromonospora sp. NPDC051543 TaxID=3364287 RepID=UPI0037B19022